MQAEVTQRKAIRLNRMRAKGMRMQQIIMSRIIQHPIWALGISIKTTAPNQTLRSQMAALQIALENASAQTTAAMEPALKISAPEAAAEKIVAVPMQAVFLRTSAARL